MPHMTAADDEQRDSRQDRQKRDALARRRRRPFAQRNQAAPHYIRHVAIAELRHKRPVAVEQVSLANGSRSGATITASVQPRPCSTSC